MKLQRILMAGIAALTLSACGGDDDDPFVPQPVVEPGQTDKPTDPTQPTVDSKNKNKNTGTDIAWRLEFPKTKGGRSEVILHSTTAYGNTYAIEWDHDLRAQRWTCFEIHSGNNVKNWARKNWEGTSWGGDPFQHDPKVPSNEQPPVRGEFSGSYYPGTNAYYQRGHICASEDRIYSKEANEQTFYMTNMMPQVGNFNGKIWADMEDRVRGWAKNVDTLYVCKGGTIDRGDYIVNYTKSGFIVPRYFFMAVLAKNAQGYKAMAFWIEHLNSYPSNAKVANYVINVRELEQKTGIDFFCNLPDDVEETVETLAVDAVKRAWGLN